MSVSAWVHGLGLFSTTDARDENRRSFLVGRPRTSPSFGPRSERRILPAATPTAKNSAKGGKHPSGFPSYFTVKQNHKIKPLIKKMNVAQPIDFGIFPQREKYQDLPKQFCE